MLQPVILEWLLLMSVSLVCGTATLIDFVNSERLIDASFDLLLSE